MRVASLIAGIACAAALSACGLLERGKAAPPPPRIDSMLGDADKALKAGERGRATEILNSAAASYPSDKAPWSRMMALSFGSKDYGAAISQALEVLERDADDKAAHSVVIASGLRLALASATDLKRKNHLGSNLRAEAHSLAKLFGTSVAPAPTPPAPAPAPAAPPPARNHDEIFGGTPARPVR